MAAINQDGRLEVFARGAADGAFWHIVQSTPGGSWSAWSSLGGSPADEASVTLAPDGCLNVFVRTLSTSLGYIEQPISGQWQ
jgi:hypothetical protein